MKARFNKTTWRAVSGIVASFLLMVSFQNCGKAGFDSDLEGQLDLGSDASLAAKYGSTAAKKVSDIPFAFEAALDTISYNSCANPALLNKEGYFSLKAGAFSSGGISLKSSFFDYADENFSPIYPAKSLSTLQYKELLSDSPANKGMTPTLAIRQKNSLTDLPVLNNEQLGLGLHIMPMVSTLTDPLVMDSFAHRGVTASYFPFSQDMKVMSATFIRNNSESLAQLFRDFLVGNATFLALTFIPPNEDIYKVAATSTSYPVKTAHGKGYTMEFSAYPGSNSVAKARIVTGVRENDLSSPTTTSRAWGKCRSYKVVRAVDAAVAGASYCPAHTQAEIRSSDLIRTELEIARRHFPASHWDINVTYGCAVPKVVSCYEEKQYAGAPIVQYDVSQLCRTGASDDTTGSQNSQCMHYLSICTR